MVSDRIIKVVVPITYTQYNTEKYIVHNDNMGQSRAKEDETRSDRQAQRNDKHIISYKHHFTNLAFSQHYSLFGKACKADRSQCHTS